MAPSAYLVYNTEIGAQNEVTDDIRKAKGVEYAHAFYGIYDGIAKINADSMAQLKLRVNTIRKTDKMVSSLMMIVIEEQK